MARKTVELRREEILQATVDEIQLRGIGALRLTDVAERLGVSSGLVVYHFETKDKLVAEAFTHASEKDLAKLHELTAGDGSVTSRLMAALNWYAPTGKAHGWHLWIEGWSAGLRSLTLQQISRGFDTRWRQGVAEVISEGVASGEYRCTTPKESATRITSMLDGLAIQIVVHHARVSKRQMTEQLSNVLAIELGVPASTFRQAD